MKKACVLSYPLSAQRRLWSDWADAQADLSLRWAQSLCWFCHAATHISYFFRIKYLNIAFLHWWQCKWCFTLMSLVTRKPVFGVCDQGRLCHNVFYWIFCWNFNSRWEIRSLCIYEHVIIVFGRHHNLENILVYLANLFKTFRHPNHHTSQQNTCKTEIIMRSIHAPIK